MKNEITNLCQWALEETLKKGATACKVSLYKSKFVDISYREHKPEALKEATTKSIWIDIYIDGRYSSQGTPDLRKASLEKFIEKACQNTGFIEQDPFRSLPDKKYIGTGFSDTLNTFDPQLSTFSPDEKHELVKQIEESCLARGGSKVISVQAGANFSEDEEFIVASNGFTGSNKSTSVWMGASMSAQDEGDRRPNGNFWVGSRFVGDLPSATLVGENAADRTLRLMGAKKLPTETLPVIVENRVAGRLLSGFLAGFMGGNIQQKRSFLLDKIGQPVASPKFSIIDNPLLPKGLNSRLYDYDGFASKKRTFLNNGVVEDFFIDWYYSRKLNCEPTTGSRSNLIVPPGTLSVGQLMKKAGRGILITDFIGGNSNSTTGDFSLGVIGQLFENGVPVQAIAEMNMADNHLLFWNKIEELGNDPWIYGGWQSPSIMFNDVVVAGV
ncbi:MAG: TldD/PmbA family protein [Bacteroidales bacterium]|nr:TldD/PmbA family protein [Bacteroidales bacterium]